MADPRRGGRADAPDLRLCLEVSGGLLARLAVGDAPTQVHCTLAAAFECARPGHAVWFDDFFEISGIATG